MISLSTGRFSKFLCRAPILYPCPHFSSCRFIYSTTSCNAQWGWQASQIGRGRPLSFKSGLDREASPLLSIEVVVCPSSKVVVRAFFCRSSLYFILAYPHSETCQWTLVPSRASNWELLEQR